MHPSVEHLWQRYRAIDPAAPADTPPAFHFCDNREDADICADLVVAGKKRATASSLAELEASGDPVPQPGEYAIVTDWAGQARAVMRTTHVKIKRLGDIDEDFAVKEGEGDLTLTWWREAHDAYFTRVLADTPYTVDDDLQIACEEFEVVLTG
ncbi:MAG: ASCH domain-containing protein [Tsuneonella suprasediminis]|uniref:ASCH domain-containing protein n=1 Tax=Tsuneonella suprasediminis TaxID=2306996 RepID=A0A419QYB0_9SPHN|nr:ASCH domain-containing protein [Tsuneonella suprasediminis]RJX65680.1 ASCH domain-containing protein [Tsuneonella suprasediminis]UBS33490.1 ASCH domain-containing protein [Altererythrobacter sp. N1]